MLTDYSRHRSPFTDYGLPGKRIVCFLPAALLLACSFSSVQAGDPVRLTHDGRLKFSPVFCNQGQEVVFAELADPTLYRLERLRLRDGSVEHLHKDAPTSEFEPAFSASGKMYAFLRTRGALSVSMVIQTSDGARVGEVPP